MKKIMNNMEQTTLGKLRTLAHRMKLNENWAVRGEAAKLSKELENFHLIRDAALMWHNKDTHEVRSVKWFNRAHPS